MNLVNIPDVTSLVKGQLINIFTKTNSYKLLDKIALIFADLGDKTLIPVLVNKIDEIKYSRHISTLIYACSEYDCAEWVDFFVRLVIDLNDSSYLEAIGVIEEIHKPITLSNKIISVKQLTDYLTSLSKENEKYEDIERVLELIEGMGNK